MECPNCGYMMDAFTVDCPRCKRLGIPSKAAQATPPKSPAPTAQRQTVLHCQTCGRELPTGAKDCPGCSLASIGQPQPLPTKQDQAPVYPPPPQSLPDQAVRYLQPDAGPKPFDVTTAALLSILFPIIGFVLGIVLLTRPLEKDRSTGLLCLVLSVVTFATLYQILMNR